MKILSYILLTITSITFAQSMTEIKKLDLNYNNISLDISNYGSLSNPGSRKDFVWNQLGYMYEFGILVGAEVKTTEGDTIHIISDSFISPSEGDYDAGGVLKWGWLPVEGYSNPNSNEVANSINPDSWPHDWNEWPGEYGNGIIVGKNEAYYKICDFTNYEFIDKYSPSNNFEMGGLGLSTKVRVYQIDGGFKDALIVKYFLTNESNKVLEKFHFGFRGDPHLGGSRHPNGDIATVIKSVNNSLTVKNKHVRNTIYLEDEYPFVYNFPIGKMAIKLLETPDDLGLTSFNVTEWNVFNPKDDEIMWNFFNEGIDTVNYLYNTPGDNVITFGTGPFSLEPNETKEVKIAIFFSYDYNDIIEDATYISIHHNWPLMKNNVGETGGNNNYKIILNPINDNIEGTYQISWDNSNIHDNASIFIEYSHNLGIDWTPIAVSLQNINSFNWNTSNIKDGVNYLIRIVAYNESNPEEYFYSVSPNRFTIDNIDFNAKPEFDLLTNFSDTTINSNPIKLKWISEDADDENLTIKFEYAFEPDGNYTLIDSLSYLNGKNSFSWDITELPNSSSYYLKVTATDGEKDSTITTKSFGIDVFEQNFPAEHITQYRGNATPNINIQIMESNKVNSDEYSLQFHVNDNIKTFDVINITQNKLLLSNYNVDENISTPLIDGMKITVKCNGNNIDYSKTKFVSLSNNSLEFNITFPAIIGGAKIRVDEDYLILFNNTDILADGSWSDPDTLQTMLGQVLAPYSIWLTEGTPPNYLRKEHATFVVHEPHLDFQFNGQWDWDEPIIFQPFGTTDATVSYQLSLEKKNDTKMDIGDSLYIIHITK